MNHLARHRPILALLGAGRGHAARAGRVLELAVLIVANTAATVVRFLLLRAWIYRRRPSSLTSSTTTARLERTIS